MSQHSPEEQVTCFKLCKTTKTSDDFSLNKFLCKIYQIKLEVHWASFMEHCCFAVFGWKVSLVMIIFGWTGPLRLPSLSSVRWKFFHSIKHAPSVISAKLCATCLSCGLQSRANSQFGPFSMNDSWDTSQVQPPPAHLQGTFHYLSLNVFKFA